MNNLLVFTKKIIPGQKGGGGQGPPGPTPKSALDSRSLGRCVCHYFLQNK